jgi:Right handed beta helix region
VVLAVEAMGLGLLAMLSGVAINQLLDVPRVPLSPALSLHVSPDGSDAGDGSVGAPLRTIQASLERATPGTVVNLAPGVYREKPVTVHDGAPGSPIVIKGPETGKDRGGRYRATLYGTGRVFSVNNSYYTFEGFTIDGQEKLAGIPLPTDVAAVDSFKDGVQSNVADGRLIYVGAADRSRGITGITIRDMFLSGAGGECIRLRNNATGNVISDSVIQYCGMFGKGDADDDRAKYHNGEGVYIGTSPSSKKQPMHRDDGSSNNIVVRNVIQTFGSECFDVKENAHDNVFEDNVCAGNTEDRDHLGSNVELRGHRNVVRNNQISGDAGYTLKIRSDDEKYDRGGNVVEYNHLSGSAAALMFESAAAQGPMCGNVVTTVGVDDDPPPDISVPC